MDDNPELVSGLTVEQIEAMITEARMTASNLVDAASRRAERKYDSAEQRIAFVIIVFALANDGVEYAIQQMFGEEVAGEVSGLLEEITGD